MKKLTFFLALLIGTSLVWGQESWLSYPANETPDSIRVDAAKKLNFNQNTGSVKVTEDPRLPKIGEFLVAEKESLEGVKIDGFRVMIFFDQKKTAAEQQKATFMSMHSDIRTYVDYLAPNYRVRVGNFRTRLEAEKLKSELLSVFPTAIVIKDKIQLPTLDSEEDTSK